MAENFRLQAYGPHDKRIEIWGPDDLILYVDYDDVNHDVVDELVKTMLTVLNRPNVRVWTDSAAIGQERAEIRYAEEEARYG